MITERVKSDTSITSITDASPVLMWTNKQSVGYLWYTVLYNLGVYVRDVYYLSTLWYRGIWLGDTCIKLHTICVYVRGSRFVQIRCFLIFTNKTLYTLFVCTRNPYSLASIRALRSFNFTALRSDRLRIVREQFWDNFGSRTANNESTHSV